MLELKDYLNEKKKQVRITYKKKRKTPQSLADRGFSVSVKDKSKPEKPVRAEAKPKVEPKRGPEYVFTHKGKWVIDTKHSAERVIQRGQLTKKQMELLYKRMIDSNPANDGTYLFSSKSLNQTIVVGVRPDYRAGDKESQFIIITFLPRGKHHSANPKDTVVIMESVDPIQIDYTVELD